ncbi:MAG: hypothetical protein SFY69_12095 [Planctomycetota bacterium]|nr:hypothetical protein [Planctomycetota bacterium]
MRHWVAAAAWLVAIACFGGVSRADDAPTPVRAGIFIVQLTEPDLRAGTFQSVFWLWFRWRGDESLNPMQKFEVVGGQVESLDNEDARTHDGEHYQIARVRATIRQTFDIARFPQDAHDLRVAVEETTASVSGIVYVPDELNSRLEPGVTLSGWTIGAPRVEAGEKLYASNFGDPALPSESESSYAMFSIVVPVARPGLGYTLKLFWSMYLSVFVALVAFWIKPTDLDPRFGLGIGAVFAAMASAYVISSTLPDSNQVTIADRVVMWSIAFIVVSLIESTIALMLCHAGNEARAIRVDRASFAVMGAGYALVNVLLLS